jgi:signal peptidase II
MPQKLLKYTLLILILLAGGATDQFSKRWASLNLKNQPQKVLVKNMLELGYTENHGMVFGINNKKDNPLSKNILLVIRILLSIGLSGYIIMNLSKPLFFHVPFLLILSGAIGNVIDSLRFGHVIDFIHMHIGEFLDWPFLYNLADAYVCIGMGILIIQSFFTDRTGKPVPTTSPEKASE